MADGSIAKEGREPGDIDPRFMWKDGFNLNVKGLPTTLLLAHKSSGPWAIVFESHKKISIRKVTSPQSSYSKAVDYSKCPVAWQGNASQQMLAERLCDRFNGYEMAREFPPGGRESCSAAPIRAPQPASSAASAASSKESAPSLPSPG